jgi:diguanylate cyclase (GGDEF)-like protein/PAS domain S-box-containing protein
MPDSEKTRQHLIEEIESLRKLLAEQRKRFNEAPSTSTERYLKAILNKLPSMIGYWDKDLRNVFANQAYKEWFGLDPESIYGKHIKDVIGEERYNLNLPYILKALSGEQQIFERIIPSPEGNAIRYSLANYIPDVVDGEVKGFFVLVSDVTPVKHAEMALRESQGILSAILDTAAEGILTIDSAGKIQSINRAATRTFGYEAIELLGRNVTMLMPEPYRSEHPGYIKRYLDTGIPRIIGTAGREVAGVKKDGTVFPLELSVSEIITGGARMFSGILRDITERRRFEQALRESEEKVKLILNSTGEAIYGVDLSGNCNFCNPACVSILGYTQPGDLLGRNMHELIHHSRADGSGYPMEECRIYRAFREGQGVHVDDEVFWRADGTWFPAEYWSSPQFKAGEVVGGVVAFVDITKRRRDEESQRRAARVFEDSYEGIMITGRDGTILDVNAAFTSITGFSKNEVLGRKPNILNSGRHDSKFYAGMWKALFSQGRWRGEIWDRKKSGEIYPKLLSIGAVYDARGEITQFVAIFTDITTIKQSEQKLEQMAHYDFLTGLPNRILFRDRLAQAIHHADRYKTNVSLIFIDLDGFKKINDALGHKAGDDLLIEVARRLESCVRMTDTVSRLGGDEFTVVLTEGHTFDFLAGLASKLIESVGRPILLGETEASVTASVGIALYPKDGDNLEELIKNADMAMYRAKEQGKNNFTFYSDIG